MPVTEMVTDPEALTMRLVADVDAPVERLWHAFTQPRQLERFWGPPGWPATFTEFDLRPGGRARYHMTSPTGEKSYGMWEFLRVDEGSGFEVNDHFVDADGTVFEGFPAMRMVYTFEPTATGSRLTNTTYFTDLEGLEQAVAMGAVEGSTLAMGQLDAALADLREFAQGKGTRVEILDDTHVRITRLIDAPAELVWRAHHDPDLLRRWQLGPDGWSMVECEVATEPGQTHRTSWEQDGDPSTRFGFEGEALLIEAPRRAVTTERMIGTEGPTNINDLSLYEEDGATLLTVLIEYADAETRDMILGTGMADGMEASYARLETAVLPPL